MQEQAGSYECLQCQYLVKTFRVFSFIEKVVSDAEVDTEDRHGQFGAYRKLLRQIVRGTEDGGIFFRLLCNLFRKGVFLDWRFHRIGHPKKVRHGNTCLSGRAD